MGVVYKICVFVKMYRVCIIIGKLILSYSLIKIYIVCMN